VPSALHQFYALAVPRLLRARELDDEQTERARVTTEHQGLRPGLPTRAVPRFARRFEVREEDAGGFPAYVVTPRGERVERTLVHLHGGAFVAPIDPFHVRYATALARALRARVVLPDYPLAPEHTWRESHDQLADLTQRWAAQPGGAILLGDSAGGGLALSVAQTLRDRGGAQPTQLVLHAPWVDLTMSAPETEEFARRDPWLHLGKAHAYARWWAGSEADLTRPEVSPAFGELGGLPPGIMFHGTRDLLAPACRVLARRAPEAGWRLSSIEEPGGIHVYGIMPGLPEARRAFRRTVEFCR
jgi:acetyl esterase/lipase